MPAVVEADDAGLYVLKFRGAGQGPKALVAELVAGELARAAGLPMPDLVLVELDPELARTEGDPEIQDLIRASAGLNLALDYLPGALTFDPAADPPDPELASAIVWFDAFVQNVDRSARNPNLMVWHRQLTLIDHGAALYFHHDWTGVAQAALSPFPLIRDHVLLPFASALEAADARMAAAFDAATIARVLALVPDAWLEHDADGIDAAARRTGYADHLLRRLDGRRVFLEEALRARAAL
nr:HipA family kinase [Xanthomonas sp. XNM01]